MRQTKSHNEALLMRKGLLKIELRTEANIFLFCIANREVCSLILMHNLRSSDVHEVLMYFCFSLGILLYNKLSDVYIITTTSATVLKLEEFEMTIKRSL